MIESHEVMIEKLEKLSRLGIQMPKDYRAEEKCDREQVYYEELSRFFKSMEFMKLGQAIAHKQWKTAAMLCQRMDKSRELLGIECFARQLTGIRQCILRRNVVQAKQTLSLMVAKRVQILELMKVQMQKEE